MEPAGGRRISPRDPLCRPDSQVRHDLRVAGDAVDHVRASQHRDSARRSRSPERRSWPPTRASN